MAARTQRKEVHTSEMPIEQKRDIGEGNFCPPEIVEADTSLRNEYFDELAFMEEPVTVRLDPAKEKNAPRSIYCAVNGRGAEVKINDKWVPITFLPVGEILITKRKFVEVLARSKVDSIETLVDDATVENPNNRIRRVTSANQSFSVIRDSERGHAWLSEMLRRNSL